MNQFLSVISDIRVVIGIAVVVLILLVWLVVEKVRTRKYRKELEGLEHRYSDIKSVPLSMKMYKAAAIARVDQETTVKVNETKEVFDRSQTAIHRISANLAACEDAILVGKLRKADDLMADLEQDLSLTAKEVKELDSTLDNILAKETAERQEVTNLKNRFRALKSQAQENASLLSYNWDVIEQKIKNTEKMFSTFEEWMYSSDFEKASMELVTIQKSMNEIESMVETMPSLLRDARGVIPKMAETLHHDYLRYRNHGVYLNHLEVEKNIQLVSKSLKDDLDLLKNGTTDGVEEHLATYKERLTQLDEEVKKEGGAHDEMKELASETEEVAIKTASNANYINAAYQKDAAKYGLTGISDEITALMTQLSTLNEQKPSMLEQARNSQIPATTVLTTLGKYHEEYASCNESLTKIRKQIEVASGDEDRARKQLIKLQIVMNQMQVKIRKYKLPAISNTYEDDMQKANEYIHTLENLVEDHPINMQLLNGTLQEALDFIYKLYNNVNNVVGVVAMLEKTIVFGNRYRSTYADIDSELTRSELLFRNGQYTQALTVAIATIEKILPGNYESMIKENAKSAE
jgi:septation ring formation regulator